MESRGETLPTYYYLRSSDEDWAGKYPPLLLYPFLVLSGKNASKGRWMTTKNLPKIVQKEVHLLWLSDFHHHISTLHKFLRSSTIHYYTYQQMSQVEKMSAAPHCGNSSLEFPGVMQHALSAQESQFPAIQKWQSVNNTLPTRTTYMASIPTFSSRLNFSPSSIQTLAPNTSKYPRAYLLSSFL
jgi:hypothetical protein